MRERPLILVADDEADILLITATRLSASGYDVITAADGSEAEAMLRTHAPDLVLLDLRMPGMDGYELCRRAKADARLRGIPIIVFSASSTYGSDIRNTCLELGAFGYIRKPYAADALLAEIRRALANAAAGQGAST